MHEYLDTHTHTHTHNSLECLTWAGYKWLNFACKVKNLYIKNTKLLIDADTSSDDNNLLDRMFDIRVEE